MNREEFHATLLMMGATVVANPEDWCLFHWYCSPCPNEANDIDIRVNVGRGIQVSWGGDAWGKPMSMARAMDLIHEMLKEQPNRSV